MATTGRNLFIGFSRFINDYWASTGSSNGTTTTIVDTALQRRGDEGWRDYYAYITESGHSALWQVRRVSTFANSSGTATYAPASTAAVNSGQAYELHKFDPAEKFTALDEARLRVYPDLHQLIFNDTLTGDGLTTAFDVPSALRRGPMFVLEETPAVVEADWNFLTNPLGDSTTNWTASSSTHTVVDRDANDQEIPKYDASCSKVAVATTTNGVLNQTVANMANSITAALAAGRHMTFAAWVYCRTASRVTLVIVTDAGTLATSTAHGGGGWELLTVEGNVAPTNATTLTARFDVSNAAGAVDFWWNRAWFYFGTPERVQDIYHNNITPRMRHDNVTNKIYLPRAPQRGHQLRLVGTDVLSALGTTATTQVTNTMEVDDPAAQVLYAEAARVLFGREQFTTADFPDLAPKIARADQLRRELKKWGYKLPPNSALVSPFA